MTLLIEHDSTSHQFKVTVEGKTCLLEYQSKAQGKVLDYYHTFVPTELRGRNIALEIVLFALNYAKGKGLKIIPSCPYVKKVIGTHPEFQEIIY